MLKKLGESPAWWPIWLKSRLTLTNGLFDVSSADNASEPNNRGTEDVKAYARYSFIATLKSYHFFVFVTQCVLGIANPLRYAERVSYMYLVRSFVVHESLCNRVNRVPTQQSKVWTLTGTDVISGYSPSSSDSQMMIVLIFPRPVQFLYLNSTRWALLFNQFNLILHCSCSVAPTSPKVTENPLYKR